MPPFDMDAFLKNFQDAVTPSDMELLMATLHHLWMDHPLKIETNIKLINDSTAILALSEKLAIDLSDVRHIRMKNGDYEISYKSNDQEDIVFANTPEFEALQAVMRLLNKRTEH